MSTSIVACEPGGDIPALPITEFEAALSGDNVVPPVTTPAFGKAAFRIEGSALAYTITVSNLNSADSARLYIGSPGANGSLAMVLCGPCTVSNGVLATGSATATTGVSFPSLVTAMRAFGVYLQIRDAGVPVLRGQLRVDP